jgi:O-methyltransferase
MKMAPRQSLVKISRSIFRSMGLAIYPWKRDYSYVPAYFGRSAHKHIDIRALPEFGPLADNAIAAGRSLLYYDRLYVIFQALQNLKRSLPKGARLNIAEVGVYRGGTSHFILSTLRRLGFQDAHLYSFDTFEGHMSEDIKAEKDTFQQAHFFSDTAFSEVQDYLKPFDNVSLYKGRFQDRAAEIAELPFGFVHLDVDIYEPTAFALDFFDKRLATGGVIVVDDYGFTTCSGIRQAVDEFIRQKTNYFVLHQLTGQCVLVKH